MKTTRTNESVNTLNNLIQGEISAVETYVQALDKFGSDPVADPLRELKDEHIEATNALRRTVHEEGGSPETSSGVWGAWAKTVEGTAKTLGKVPALKALKEGEEHGARDYQDALEYKDLNPEVRELIQSILIPRCKNHIKVLNALMEDLL